MDRIMQVGKSNKHVLNWNLNQIQLVQTGYKTSKWLTPFLKGKKEKKKKKHSTYIDYQKKRATQKVKEKRNIVYTIIFIIFFTRVEFESFFY